MDGRIIWTDGARKELKEILHYWKQRNKSDNYSKKLRAAIQAATTVIALQPQAGSRTTIGEARKKIVKDYIIFYQEIDKGILILSIWDTRQDPDNLKSRLSEK
jgi:plasmid stabilization system protein ParE